MSKIAIFLIFSLPILAECPEDRPYPRGSGACDSCPWEQTVEDYKAGELSEIRDSQVFGHQIRVSIVCDTNRPIDVDDVFAKINDTERMFSNHFDVSPEDGEGVMLEVVTGICDQEESVDDCNMYEVCRSGGAWRGCDLASGLSYANTGGLADHITFVPFLPEGVYWWAEGNRYANLQHEYSHLLDFTYIRRDILRGTDTNWWVEGMPQFIQWRILNDSLSWHRGNDEARILEIFTHRHNTSDYFDGLRLVAYLSFYAPYLLDEVVKDLSNGVYQDSEAHLKYFFLLGHIASSH